MTEQNTEIFISYRRKDYNAVCRVYDRLRMHFGDRVYLDVEANTEAADYRELIEENLTNSKVVLVFISPGWINEFNQRDPDWNFYEIKRALECSKHIMPVLIDGAQPPTEAELPTEISKLAFQQASSIDMHGGFHDSVSRLVKRIAEYVDVEAPPGCGRQAWLLTAGITLLMIGLSILGQAYNLLLLPLPHAQIFWDGLSELIWSHALISAGPLLIVLSQRLKCLQQAKERRELFKEGITLFEPPKNRTAIWGLALAVASFGLWILAAIPALVMSALGLWQISKSNGRSRGDGIAIAGILTAVSAILLLYFLGRPVWERYRGYCLLDQATSEAEEGNLESSLELANHATHYLGTNNINALLITGQLKFDLGEIEGSYLAAKEAAKQCKNIYNRSSSQPVDFEMADYSLRGIQSAIQNMANCASKLGSEDVLEQIELQSRRLEVVFAEFEDLAEKSRYMPLAPPQQESLPTFELNLPDLQPDTLQAPVPPDA